MTPAHRAAKGEGLNPKEVAALREDILRSPNAATYIITPNRLLALIEAAEQGHAAEAREGWFVSLDTDAGCWTAEHTTKRGLVAAGLWWDELGCKMVDAEAAWEEGMAAPRGTGRRPAGEGR